MNQRETACITVPPGPSLFSKVQIWLKTQGENLQFWWKFHKEDVYGFLAASVVVSLIACCAIGIAKSDIEVNPHMPSTSSSGLHRHHGFMHQGSLLHRSSSRRSRRR